MCVIGHGRQNIGQTAIRHVNMAKKWKRPKTAQKHEIRLNAEKTSQERANSASEGHGRAGFPIPHVTRLKNWPVFESGHVRYRKPSPPMTFGGRIRPFLTCFLRIEPDFMFLGRFGTFPLFCHVDMSNGCLAYVLPPVTYNTHFSTI